jgi:hypothetical protein
MPPAAFTPSAAIFMPLTEEMPKLAVSPVSDMNTPILTLSAPDPPPPGWQANDKTNDAINPSEIRILFIWSSQSNSIGKL